MLKLLLGNPYVLIGIVAAFALSIGSAIWFHHAAVAAEKGEKAARLESDLHAADAARFQVATADRDAVILSLKASLDEQSAAIQASRAKETELRKSLDSARLENDRLSADMDQNRKDTIDEATHAPSDVRPLGPIILRRAPSLLD